MLVVFSAPFDEPIPSAVPLRGKRHWHRLPPVDHDVFRALNVARFMSQVGFIRQDTKGWNRWVCLCLKNLIVTYECTVLHTLVLMFHACVL